MRGVKEANITFIRHLAMMIMKLARSNEATGKIFVFTCHCDYKLKENDMWGASIM